MSLARLTGSEADLVSFASYSCCIAFYESRFEPRIHEAFEQLQDSEREVYGDEDRDPDLHESSSSGGVGKICQVSFAELKKGLPDAKISIQDEILEEVSAGRRRSGSAFADSHVRRHVRFEPSGENSETCERSAHEDDFIHAHNYQTTLQLNTRHVSLLSRHTGPRSARGGKGTVGGPDLPREGRPGLIFTAGYIARLGYFSTPRLVSATLARRHALCPLALQRCPRSSSEPNRSHT